MLRRADGDARRERRDGLVADVLVDEIRRLPQRRDVDAGVEAHAGERLAERLARDAVQRQREREHRARDQLRAGARCCDRRRERASAGALDVDPDRQAARLGKRRDELGGAVRLQRSGGIVQEHANGAEIRQHPRTLDEGVDLPGAAGAVDEPGLEVPLGRDDRLGGLAEVRDVVQRVVEAEDVDAVLGRRGDEAPGEVRVDGTRADEEAPAERQAEGRLHASLEGADPLPGALDAALDGRVEAAAARDLEVGEAGAVEDLGELELVGGRHAARKRLLPEQANGRVGERRHGGTLPRLHGTAVSGLTGDVARSPGREHQAGGRRRTPLRLVAFTRAPVDSRAA